MAIAWVVFKIGGQTVAGGYEKIQRRRAAHGHATAEMKVLRAEWAEKVRAKAAAR